MDEQRRDAPHAPTPYEAPSVIEVEAPVGTTETAPGSVPISAH
jgi:hypothetical protein